MSNWLKMAEAQSILALARLGWSYRRIAAEVGVDRETVSRHVKAVATASGVAPGTLPAGEPPGSNATISITGPAVSNGTIEQLRSDGDGRADVTGVGPGSNAAISIAGSAEVLAGRRSRCEPWRELIVQGLSGGLSAQRIWQDLKDDHQFPDGYQSVQRFVRKLGESLPLPVRRMEVEAGQEAQVDFGRGAPVVGSDGKRRSTWVFRIVLSHSRKAYAEAVYRQTTDDFLRCLENAFACFGGVPRTLVIDNLRAAVKRADWFDPELCPKVRSFAGHYGTAILPTKPYTPRHKGKVENSVKYVKGNALKGRTFTSLAEENQQLAEWESKVADLRIHGTTRQQVRQLFNEVERPTLLPMPPSRFDLFQESLRQVHRDGHVQVQGAYYSAPPEYLGQQLWARWDGRTVRLFDQRMNPIAVHAQKQPGAFSTMVAHIHPHKISGIEKGTDWMLGQVDRIGPKARAWAEAMLGSRGIEGVRVLMGLISLGNQSTRQLVERACEVALSHGAYHLRGLRQLIKHQSPGSDTMQQTFAFASEHPIIRPVADYGQWLNEALTRQPAERAWPSAQENLP
jgi:transposase